MEQKKISVFQLIILLYLCRSFNLFTASMHNVTGDYGMTHLLAIPLAAVIQLVMILPAALLMKRTGRGMTESAQWTLGRAGLIYPVFSSLYLILLMGVTAYNLASFMANAVYHCSTASFFVISLFIFAGYGAYLGLEGISRSALIVFVVFTLSLLLTFLGVMNRVELINIHPLEEGGVQNVFSGAWKIAARSSTVWLYALLSPNVREKKKQGFFWYLLAVVVLMEAVTFFISAVLGKLASGEAYPLFLLTTIAQISVFQRMDAFHVSIWVMVSFLRIALFMWISVQQLKACLPVAEQQGPRTRWILPFLAIASAMIAMALVKSRRFSNGVLGVMSSGAIIVTLIAGFPLVCLIVGSIRRKFSNVKGEQ